MPIVLQNALLCDIDPIRVEPGELRLANGRIEQRGPSVTSQAGDERVDCRGAVVLPGLVNGHTHLYSALATGMPPPPRAPRDFHEILQLIWWRLDRALDAESIEASALIGAIDAVHCGTTTLIDHHASPNLIAGSLDLIERGLNRVGVRGVLCYETTDRNGQSGRDAGLEENRRYILRTQQHRNGQFAAAVGAHASFTLDDTSLAAVARLANDLGVGVHIHVAEDPCDRQLTQQRFGKDLLQRLADNDLLNPRSIFAHCIHLSDEEINLLNEANVTIAHNPRSNMNNAVGYAPIGKLKCPIMLGTDGIGADIFAEARHAWLKSRDAGAGISPDAVIAMLATAARRASQSLGVILGRLEVGAAADVVITDYIPATPLNAANFIGHFLFGMESRHVGSVLIDGQWALRDRVLSRADETRIRHDSRAAASRLWQRLQAIAPA